MTSTSAEAALDRMEADEDFARRVRDAGGPEASIALLSGEGFDVTPAEMRDAVLDRYAETLTPDQLDQLAGGLNKQEQAGLAIGAGAGLALIAVAAGSAAV